MNKLAPLLVVLSFLIVGCETEEQKQAREAAEREKEQAALNEQRATDAINACAEIAQTSRGFGGPSKRMEILKGYGWEPRQASQLEDIFKMGFSVRDATEETCSRGSSIMKASCDCVAEVRSMLSCEVGYIAVLNGAEGEIAQEALNKYKTCM